MKNRSAQQETGPVQQANSKPILYIVVLHLSVVILTGAFALLTKNSWLLTLLIPLGLIVWMVITSFYKQKTNLIVLSLLLGISSGLIILLVPLLRAGFVQRLGLAVIVVGFSWLVIWILSRRIFPAALWWTVLPGCILCGIGLGFIYSPMQIFDLIFFVGLSTGAGLLIWGIGQKLFGLIIAGSLVFSISPGITFSWKWITPVSILSQIGIMLVWFALGWGLITISSRVVIEKFIWWPLIPAGVLSMVGLGLYLGGDPAIASAVLSNSGAMGIILFGLYMTLMRWRIKR